MKLVVIESPYKGNVARNKAYLQRCIRDCFERGEAPFASHQMYTDALDDDDDNDRALGICAGLAWAEQSILVVVYTDYGISEGMARAIYRHGIRRTAIEFRQIGQNRGGAVMDEQQRVAYLNAMVACAMIEAMGMQAENEQRKACGHSMAYTMDNFLEVIEKYGIGHNQAMGMIQDRH